MTLQQIINFFSLVAHRLYIFEIVGLLFDVDVAGGESVCNLGFGPNRD